MMTMVALSFENLRWTRRSWLDTGKGALQIHGVCCMQWQLQRHLQKTVKHCSQLLEDRLTSASHNWIAQVSCPDQYQENEHDGAD